MLTRVFHYASPHSRVRARIGAMPDKDQWQYIVAARDLDTSIQRMRENGLARWVGQLSRAPGTRAIEKALRQGVADVVGDVCRWLPARWRDTVRWMQTGLVQLWVQDLLRNAECDLPRQAPAALQGIAAQPLEHRREALQAAGFARHVEQDHLVLLEEWLRGFDAACPALRGGEARAVLRIRRLLVEHRVAVLDASRRAWREYRPQESDDLTQWRLRERLAARLRDLLGYETFHGGFLLLYVVLELLQFERCRALLLARSRGWDAAGVA